LFVDVVQEENQRLAEENRRLKQNIAELNAALQENGAFTVLCLLFCLM